MLNYIWGFMIIIGIIYGSFTGNMEAITNAALDSAKEAVSLCITMVGVMALWVGLMEVAKEAGLIAKFTKAISQLVTFLFPNIPKGHEAREHISTNIIANILGLGWAATPAGLKAMESLSELEQEREAGQIADNQKRKPVKKRSGIASDEMCTFLIINISSRQLIPVNIIAYRSQYGSVNPASIIGPGLVATLVSTIVAIVFCKIKTIKK